MSVDGNLLQSLIDEDRKKLPKERRATEWLLSSARVMGENVAVGNVFRS
jgi:hypothetical protein